MALVKDTIKEKIAFGESEINKKVAEIKQELEEFKNNDILENKSQIISFLEELGCCSRCILIYMGVSSYEGIIDNFINAEETLLSLKSNNQSFELPLKKLKKNLCISCLGLLDNVILEENSSQITPKKLSGYVATNFTINTRFPKCTLIRIHSILIHLKEKFSNINIEELERSAEINLKKVYRTLLIDALVRKCEIPYKPTSNFELDFTINYSDDDKELKGLTSRSGIAAFISKHNNETFKAKFPVPPTVPVKKPIAEVIIITKPLYLGGRYLKFKRNIGQTPWYINGKAMTETSVSEIIFNSINKVLRCDYQMTFSSSGREDADVRMLGQGRPFYIQINSPKFYDLTNEQFRAIEEDILKTEKVAVIKFQIITQSELKKIKDGEQVKNKHYSAMCHVTGINIDNVLSKINAYEAGLEIAQRTPIRVLHRRTLDVRNRRIQSMKATKVEGHSELFSLDLVTQAGTYVKEFVNSDFKRTTPSLVQLIGHPIDIVALDVLNVQMEWP